MNFPGAGAPSGGASGYDPNDPTVKKLNSLMESCYAKTAMSGVAGFGLGALFGMFMASMAYDTPFHTAAPVTSTPAASTTAAAATTSGTAATSSTTPQPKAATSSSPIARAAAATANSTVAPIKTPTAAAAAATASAPSAAEAAAAAATVPPAGAGAAMLPNPGAPLSSLPLRQQLAVGFKDMGARSYSTAKNFAMVGALFSGIECGIEGLRAKNDMGNGVAAGCITGAILARNGGPQAAAVGCAGFAAFSAAIDAWLRMPKDE